MTSSSNSSGRNSSGSGSSSATSGTSATPQIREFVYLNQNKVFSYLSQLEGGLKLLYSKVQEDSWSETIGDAETTTDVGASIKGTIEGKLEFLAGISGEVAGDWKRSVADGGDSRTDGQRNTSYELFGLHHRAFDLVMDKIGGRFIKVTGQIFIIDAETVIADIKDFPDIIKNLNVFLLAGAKQTAPKNTAQIYYLLKKYLKGKILVILKSYDDLIYTAYLERAHVTYAISDVIMDYGMSPISNFTLVGLSAQPQAASNARAFSVPHYSPEAQGVSDQFLELAGAMQGMADFFSLRSATGHIVPLALYLDL